MGHEEVTRPGGVTTVLVVDDVPASRYALGAVLRRAGHRVLLAGSAGEALLALDARLRAGELPDVALVDVGLPDMSGYDLCRRMKESPTTAALPVVHFSAVAHGSLDRCRGLDAGAEAYLTVPAEPEEIQAVVRAAARGARRRSAATTRAGRLTLLAEAVLDIQSAGCPGELAETAATQAARLSGTPAAAFVLDDEGEMHRGLSRRRAVTALPDQGAHDAVARLLRSLMSGRTGSHSTVIPAPVWPSGFFGAGPFEPVPDVLEPYPDTRTGNGHGPDGGRRYDDTLLVPPDGALLALARTRDDHAPVCLATPAHAREHATELTRLAHATARVAEQLFMYEKERHVALTLQRSFLPARLPRTPGAEVVVRYEPASRQAEIGGDFYAALPTPAGVLTGIGDVVGHSLDAATVMVELRHALRAYCVEDPDPGALTERLDRMLQRYHPDVTATLCLALVDPASGRARIANAGHIPPLVVRDAGTADYVRVRGPLLGLGLPRPETVDVRLTPADRLLMVTDGLIETRGTDLAVSMEHLRVAAAGAPHGVAALCDTLFECFDRERDDDIALLALRLTAED
ncbi:fused response regulator/phosphatase [Streptomyces spectabilis]|uniref:Fused response regulator/phosphatase n=1 Tax=Streptomyces spectabilis TaxID=68270 RepID=A0A516R697_STRST|nr:fused response regulator/phosphatase [Streptomyces spectabilis]QDQ11187.1 fused response regulator/phosphatase [Streptomyces spectabilis]